MSELPQRTPEDIPDLQEHMPKPEHGREYAVPHMHADPPEGMREKARPGNTSSLGQGLGYRQPL